MSVRFKLDLDISEDDAITLAGKAEIAMTDEGWIVLTKSDVLIFVPSEHKINQMLSSPIMPTGSLQTRVERALNGQTLSSVTKRVLEMVGSPTLSTSSSPNVSPEKPDSASADPERTSRSGAD